MLPEVEKLLQIQELDKEVLELTSQLQRYKGIWEEVKAQVPKCREAVEKAEKERDRHVKEQRRTEQKLRLFADDLRKAQLQQGGLKSAREYEANVKQAEAIRQKIGQAETAGLELLEKTPAVEQAVVDAKAALKKIEDTYTSEKERIRLQFNEKKARLAEVQQAREEVAGTITKDILATYATIAKRHPGSVVVTARAKSCGGCHFSLVPQLLVQIRQSDRLTTCNNCGRILAFDESPSEALPV